MAADAAVTLAALMLESCIGYPRVLLASIGHPVTWIGQLLNALEHGWNDPQMRSITRRLLGVATMLIVAGLAALVGHAIAGFTDGYEYGLAAVAIVATVGLAQRSFYQHVRNVLATLQADDIVAARNAVGRIVGRDTVNLSPHQVSSAAIESLAESFNDAVVAPAFWLFVAGLPGLFAYKAINTADSVIGHREERWRAFGWAAARLDDVTNLVPARIAGVLIAVAAGRGFAVMWRDASKHASPNAGWPEAAMAGALDELIVRGQRVGVLDAKAHGRDKQQLLQTAVDSYRRLSADCDWIIV
ncbi:MAG: adenosylcobinamide-phosphate synthase CbiB, partial [Steroidobacteraceae bacterium]